MRPDALTDMGDLIIGFPRGSTLTSRLPEAEAVVHRPDRSLFV
jgi:hypothetical protein